MLEQSVEENTAVTLLTGAAGTGKTMLMRAIVARYRDHFRIGWIGQNPAGLEHPVESTLQDLGVAVRDGTTTEMLAALRLQLMADIGNGRWAFLIVDNAHLMSDAALEQLSLIADLESDGIHILPILMAGEPLLLDRLGQPQNSGMLARIDVGYELPPLTVAETAGYIEHRLEVANCNCHFRDSPFDSGSLKVLHHWSGGIPGVLNRQAQLCLHEATQDDRRDIGAVFADMCLRNAVADDRVAGPGVARTTPTARVDPKPPPKQAVVAERPPPAAESYDVRHLPVVVPIEPLAVRPPRTGRLALAGGLVAAAVLGLVLLRPEGITLSRPATGVDVAPDNAADQAGAVTSEATLAVAPTARPDTPPLVTIRLNAPADPDGLLTQALELTATDPEAASLLMQRAALNGNGWAAYFLGQFFETGEGGRIDVNRARGWYLAADGISAATAGAAALPDPSTVPDPPTRPLPLLQVIHLDGAVELHWRAADGESPALFAVEYAGSEDDAPRRIETERSAIIVEGPVSRWRVIALGGGGADAGTSDWVSPAPAPPG